MTDLSKTPILIDANILGDLLRLFPGNEMDFLSSLFSDGRKLYLPTELAEEFESGSNSGTLSRLVNRWAASKDGPMPPNFLGQP